MSSKRLNLEDVFKRNGVPTHTFVEPLEFNRVLVTLRTPGRGLVVEGPSGIGKTTAIDKAIDRVGFSSKIVRLSARKPDDIELIRLVPEMKDTGLVIIDDFHKLDHGTQTAIADKIKSIADEETGESKIVVVGINDAGKRLINIAEDLVNRIDIIAFERNPDEKLYELIEKGEKSLSISISCKKEIVDESLGGFFIAQMLCSEICMSAGVTESVEGEVKRLDVSFEGVKSAVWQRLGDRFKQRCSEFCRGNRFRKEGRAPYLHILHWLGTGGNWVLDIPDAMRAHPEMRNSVGQTLEKGFLQQLIAGDPEISAVLHFDSDSGKLVAEDPQFIFYLRNVPWKSFADELGFEGIGFESRYDFALSFSGADRDIAERVFEMLTDAEMEVFYDKNEAFRILAENVEEYLGPIYNSEASLVVAIMGSSYPKRLWTQFESRAFRDRFKSGQVVPVLVDDFEMTDLSDAPKIGYTRINRGPELDAQLEGLVSDLVKKVHDTRH